MRVTIAAVTAVSAMSANRGIARFDADPATRRISAGPSVGGAAGAGGSSVEVSAVVMRMRWRTVQSYACSPGQEPIVPPCRPSCLPARGLGALAATARGRRRAPAGRAAGAVAIAVAASGPAAAARPSRRSRHA